MFRYWCPATSAKGEWSGSMYMTGTWANSVTLGLNHHVGHVADTQKMTLGVNCHIVVASKKWNWKKDKKLRIKNALAGQLSWAFHIEIYITNVHAWHKSCWCLNNVKKWTWPGWFFLNVVVYNQKCGPTGLMIINLLGLMWAWWCYDINFKLEWPKILLNI